MNFTSHHQLTNFLDQEIHPTKTVGFVPTMGALHEGHLSLMQTALKQCDHLVVSIFVNPTQFDNKKDLDKYPRSVRTDIALIHQHIDQDQVTIYHPSVSDVYGENAVSKSYNFKGLDQVMEGANRPGHFDGVGTILEFLFKVVNPDKAFFGEKDFQQLQIIKKLVTHLKLDLEIIGCPIKREPNGLAMSSRNARLTPSARKDASFIHKTLLEVKKQFSFQSIEESISMVKNLFKDHPNIDLEYFSIASEQDLEPTLHKRKNQQYRAFIVAHLEGVRLIDNMPLYDC